MSNWKNKLPKNWNKDDEIAALTESIVDYKTQIANYVERQNKHHEVYDRMNKEIKLRDKEITRLNFRLDAVLYALGLMKDVIRTREAKIEDIESHPDSVKLAV